MDDKALILIMMCVACIVIGFICPSLQKNEDNEVMK
jgi:hypothetical protein